MTVLAGVVPVFMIVALGVMARRLGWIDAAFVRQLYLLIYYLALPALLVRLVSQTRLDECLSGPLVAICLAATALVGALVWLLTALRGMDPTRRGVLVQAAVRGNVAYVAFPVILAVGGDPALRLAAVTSAALIPFQNLVAIAALAAGRSGGWLSFLRNLLLNPVVLGVVAGVGWSLTGWDGWTWLNEFLDILAALAMPGALIALGGQLELQALRVDLRAASLAAAAKMALLPALGWAALVWLGVGREPLLVGTFLLACPTAVASIAVAQGMEGDTGLAGAVVVTTTLLALPAYVGWGLLAGF